MGTFINLTNKVFNNIYVDEYLGESKWRCHCLSCNNYFIKRTSQIKRFGCNNCWKNSVNEKYFENIDTSNKAYIFGFLWADGTNDYKHKKIKLDVQEDDLDILKKIKEELQWTGNITSYIAEKGKSYRTKTSVVYRIAIINEKISRDLKDKGFVPHRENSNFPYEYIPKEFYIDFIRGYFDGNGTISFNKDFKNLTVNICGGTNIVLDIGKILYDFYNIEVKYYKRRPSNPTNLTLAITKNKFKINFLNIIYNNNTELFLNRKYKKYQKYKNSIK